MKRLTQKRVLSCARKVEQMNDLPAGCCLRSDGMTNTQSASSSVWATWPRTQDSQLGGMDRLQTDEHDSRRGRQTWKQTLASHRSVILSASLTATKQENKDLHYYENPFHSRIKATCLSCSQAELLKLLHEKVQKRTTTAPHLSSGVQTGQNQRGLSELKPGAD